MANLYRYQNSAMQTTAAPVKQPTGASVHTMLQVLHPTQPLAVVEWGISFDGSVAATPIEVELITTGTIAATMSTAAASVDVTLYNNAPADPNLPTGAGLTLTTAGTGFATTALTSEGSITAVRSGDVQLIAPTTQYIKQMPLGQPFWVPAANVLRIRVTPAASVNAYCYVIFGIGGD